MSNEPKVRPSMSVADMQVITSCIEYKLNAHIRAGDTNNPLVLRLMKLKDYCNTFVAGKKSPEDIIREYLAKQAILGTPMSESAAMPPIDLPAQNIPLVTGSPVDNKELTDEQRYELLKLRDSSTYTDAESAFFLNVGTMIAMKQLTKKPINAGDL